jgi:radical SAM superfamily enzyme YgiQ (UPF0313 family)
VTFPAYTDRASTKRCVSLAFYSLKILLISTNTYTTPDPVFPLGLAQVAGALRNAGHDVETLDMLASAEPLLHKVQQASPDFIGISLRNIDDVLIRKRETFFGSLPDLCALMRSVVASPIVLGGSGFSIFPRELLTLSTADFGVQGEGAEAFLALINALARGAEFRDIPGLVYREGTEVRCNLARGVPAGTGIPPSPFQSVPDEITGFYLKNGGILNLQTQRGCAHHCCYCTYPVIEGRNHRPRDPLRIADDFEAAIRVGAKYLFVVDSVFNSSPGHVRAICEEIVRRGVRVSWGCFLRPQGLNHELLELMVRAGLSHAEFGSDSFSDSVLEACGKRLTFADIKRSSEAAQQVGLDYCHFLICGGPGETMQTLEECFSKSQELPGAINMAVVGMRIYPGTDLHRRALAEGIVTPHDNLLHPRYYLAPGLETEQVFKVVTGFANRSSNWIVGDPSPEYERLVERLRGRGVIGPLWSYLSMIRRLWPQGFANTAGTQAG